MIKEDLFKLTNKVAIITGGMGALGRAIAISLATFGADIVIADKVVKGVEQIKKEFADLNKKPFFIKADVSNLTDVNNMVKETLNKFGKIDILVNNAGITKRGPALTMDEGDWNKVIDVNLKGVFLCSQTVGKEMKRQKKGKIINVASILGQIGISNTLPYCASKGGVIQITKALAIEWAKYNINVNAIAPTFFDTPLTKPFLKQGEELYNYTMERIPLGRFGKPEDLAGAIVFLASNASDFITGHILNVDGGWLAA